MKVSMTLFALVLLNHFAVTAAKAQSIGVNINNSTGTQGTTSSLLDSNGNPTGITLTHVSQDGYNSNTDTSTPNGTLLHGEDKTTPLGDQNGSTPYTSTYTFNNVPAGSYNVIAYIEDDQSLLCHRRIDQWNTAFRPSSQYGPQRPDRR